MRAQNISKTKKPCCFTHLGYGGLQKCSRRARPAASIKKKNSVDCFQLFQHVEIVLDVSLAALEANRAWLQPADCGRNDLRDGSGAPRRSCHIGRAFFRTSGRHADLDHILVSVFDSRAFVCRAAAWNTADQLSGFSLPGEHSHVADSHHVAGRQRQ